MKKPKSGSCLLSKTQSYSTKLMNFFNLPIPPPPFSSLLSPDSYTLHSLFLSRKTRRCTSSSSSFSFLFVGLSATPPSPSRVLCGNQRPSLISLISCMLKVIVILMIPRTFMKRSIVVMIMMMKKTKIIKLKDHMRQRH
nr:uncharacterized protein LOC114821702 isoform X2 [Malus domestica]